MYEVIEGGGRWRKWEDALAEVLPGLNEPKYFSLREFPQQTFLEVFWDACFQAHFYFILSWSSFSSHLSFSTDIYTLCSPTRETERAEEHNIDKLDPSFATTTYHEFHNSPVKMEALEFIPNQLSTWANNFVRNATHMWDGMTLIKYIRLIAIVGAYVLLRPYLMKLGAKLQAKEHEKELDPYEMATADEKSGGKAKISPNNLRGIDGKVVELQESDSEEEAEGTGTDVKWGKKARKRQRAVIKKVLEDEERIRRELQEEDEDKDIMEYLVDYESGKDGW